MRYLPFGAWSRDAGLRQVPVSPILDPDLLPGVSEALSESLAGSLNALPFDLADRHELWLLDPDGLPFALLASFKSQPGGPGVRREP
jgi:hypothetical protein